MVILGTTINDRLSFRSHVLEDVRDNNGWIKKPSLLKSLKRKVTVIKYVRKYLPPEKAKTIANALIHGKYVFGISLWGHLSTTNYK